MMKWILLSTFMFFSALCFSADVKTTLKKVAKEEKVNYKLLCSIARMESGLNPKAKAAKGSARGLFGVVKATEKTLRKRYKIKGSIYNPYTNAKMGAKLIKENQRYLKRKKIDGNNHNTYITHFFGSFRGVKFLRLKNNVKVCTVFKKECKYNKFMRNKTKKTMNSFFANRLKKSMKRCK